MFYWIFFFFFFSSRRRHTRCGRDWSSDVCSSDLAGLGQVGCPTGDEIGPEERLSDADHRERECLRVESEPEPSAFPCFDEDVAERIDDPALQWACLGSHHPQRALGSDLTKWRSGS